MASHTVPNSKAEKIGWHSKASEFLLGIGELFQFVLEETKASWVGEGHCLMSGRRGSLSGIRMTELTWQNT